MCSVFGEATGWCVGRVRNRRGSLEAMGLGAGPRKTAAQVSANRIVKSLLPGLPGSRQVGWEAPGMAVRTLGEEGRYPILPQFPHLNQNIPRTPLSCACLWRGSRGAWMKQHFALRGEFAASMVCPQASHFTAWAQSPPLSKEGNSDTYLIELF